MEPTDFDKALVTSALSLAAATGWRSVTVAEAARAAGLDLAKARTRFPGRGMVLLRLGQMADAGALDQATLDGSERDRVFDMVMRRLDVFQTHRDGVLAVLRDLPADPGLAAALLAATGRSMAWLLEAAGIETTGITGLLRQKGMVAVWLYVLRAWQKDDSEDLAGTMSALDKALDRAERASSWFGGARRPTKAEAAPEPTPDIVVPGDLPEPPLSPPPAM